MASKNFIGLARLTEVFTLIKNTLHKVAFSGSFNDLDDKPTIEVTAVQTTGTKIAEIDINGSPTDLYAPGGSGDYVQKAGDTMTGNLVVNRKDGTTSAVGKSQINLGNSTPEGTDKNSYGRLLLYGKGAFYTFLQATNSTANRTIELPDKNGTVALTSDVPNLDNVIPADGDLNDCTTVGFYSCTGGNSVANKPSGVGHFGLIVTHSASGDQWVQILADSGNGKTFVRYRGSSGWSSWEEFAIKSDIPDISTKVSKSGDTMTGALSIERSGNDTPLVLKRTDTTSSVYAAFRNSGGLLGYLGVNNSKKPVFYDNQDHVLAYASDIPTNTNQLTNGAGFITSSGSCAGATKATQDADGNDIRNRYVHIYNQNGGSSGLTPTQMAASGFCVGMVNGATDNPQGAAKWVHVLSMPWAKGSSSAWISQLAFGVEGSNGLWYRTTQGNISGAAWKRIIDSSNIGSQSVNYATSAGSATDSTARNTANNALPKAGGTMTGDIIMSTTRQVQFGDSTIFIGKDSSSWLHIRSNNGNVYRSAYHDFKNAANNAYAGISVGGATMFYGSTSASTWSCDANEVVISENRGNGFCVRAESGLWVRPRGTGTSFKPVAASAFNVNSSIRYKENIQPLSEEEARKLLEVEAVTYDYKDKENSDDRSVLNQRGVIAEQVEEIIPSVVTLEKVDGEDVPGYVDYSKFVPYLIKMVQMQQKEIDALNAKVNFLMLNQTS